MLTCVVLTGAISDDLLPDRELLLFSSDDFLDDEFCFSSKLP